jgi:hypothetical protein
MLLQPVPQAVRAALARAAMLMVVPAALPPAAVAVVAEVPAARVALVVLVVDPL